MTAYTRLIKKEAKKDKKKFLLEQMKDTLPVRDQWAGIKMLKKKHTPNFTKLKDKDGLRVGPSRRAEAIADYLHTVQWKAEALPPEKGRGKILNDNLGFNTSDFTLDELNFAIRKANNNKAAGPDEITAELFKFLNPQNRTCVLDIINEWWSSETIPAEQLRARVVTNFKKGDTQNIANYRQISLLNAFYKLFAAMIRKRLADIVDPHISNTQFGFRAHRSTTHALFVARRLQDIGEQSGDNVVLTLLDWEKAFDKVAHNRMLEALERLNLPQKFLRVIGSLYNNPSFQVKH